MAAHNVEVCAGEVCMICSSPHADTITAAEVAEQIDNAKQQGKLFFCCGSMCLAISSITRITEKPRKTTPKEEKPRKTTVQRV